MLRMKRRSFLKLAAATGAAAALGPKLVGATLDREHPQGYSGDAPDAIDTEVIRSCCLACHGGCGIQVKVKGGEAIKIDGNPYASNTYDYIAKGEWAVEDDLEAGSEGPDLGSVCPKGAAGIYTLYNPRRLLHPIKRVGARGSRKWKRITWDQAYSEIINGGNLFGEGHVDGLKAIRSDEPIGAADSDYMDEAPPTGYGPKKNQYYWMRGRNENSKSTDRWHKTFGTINKGTHWTICEASAVHFMAILSGGPWGAWDLKNATYAISAGCNVYDASFTAQTQARYMSKWFLRRAGTKLVYLGPRENKAAGNSPQGEWVPIKTETDPAFGLGMIRYIIENNLYNADMMSRPNKATAEAGGYPTSTDFTHLVSTTEPKTYTGQVSVNGVLTNVDDATGPADLEANVPGASTVFTLLKERAMEHTMDWYNDHCGIPRGTIERITSEFAAAEKPVIFQYKGPCQQSNATGVQAYCIVNLMMDRYYRVGGFSGGGGYVHGHLGWAEKVKREGVCASRASDTYAGSKAKPTKPWFPLNPSKGGDGVQQQCYPGIASGYPFKLKAMSHYRSDAVYTLARAQPARKTMEVVPLTFAIDPFMNETSMLSDYVLPDTTYLEHYGYMHAHPMNKYSEKAVRQPVVGTVDHKAQTYTPIHPDTKTVDQIHLDLLLKMGLPNAGKNADGEGNDIYTDYQLWNVYYNGEHIKEVVEHVGAHKAGLDPEAPHMRIGGIFGSQAHRLDLATGKHTNAYLSNVAGTKNSLTGAYMDGLPHVGRLLDGEHKPIAVDTSVYTYELGTQKNIVHTQGRTAENLWLMSLEPENALEMNPVDAAKYGVDTGDWVELENWSGDKGKYKVKVTNTMRPGYGEVKNSFGHWELGSKDIEIEGHEGGGIKGDPRVGAGFNITYLMAHDPAQSGDKDTIGCLTDPVGGSSKQYGYPVKVRRV
ncbi:MAG: molybdopterin-dependent oxidoreductase [Candidatus Hydrothermarchaeales archaeon]